MNSNRYRTIFSKRLGMLVAVAETTKAQGKGSSAVPGSGARVGRAASCPDAENSLLTGATCYPIRMTRVALAVASTLGFSGQALAADECGVEAAGADTITCTDPAYASGIVYENSDGLTLNLDNAAMVVGPTADVSVRVESSVANTNDIVINATNFSQITSNDAVDDTHGLFAHNAGTAGDAAIALTNGTVTVSGNSFNPSSYALRSLISDPTSTGSARVTMQGGSVITQSPETQGLVAENAGLGDAIAELIGGDYTSTGVSSTALTARIENDVSTGTARATMSGGSIELQLGGDGLFASTTGLGDSIAEMIEGEMVITYNAGVVSNIGNSDSTATARATMLGGSITVNEDGTAISSEHEGLGDAISELVDGDISLLGEYGFGLYSEHDDNVAGVARTLMRGGSITAHEAGSTALFSESEGGNAEAIMMAGTIVMMDEWSDALRSYLDGDGDFDALARIEGGTIATHGPNSGALYSYRYLEAGAGRSVVEVAGGTVTTQGDSAHGAMAEMDNVGVAVISMSAGSVAVSGANADALYATSRNGTFLVNVTGGSATGGAGTGAAIHTAGEDGGAVNIGSAATITAGASGIAIRDTDADTDWDGVPDVPSNAVITTAGTVTGDVLLGLGTDTVNITGGTLDGDITGDGADAIDFALGSGAFIYAAPYTISGIDTATVSSGTATIHGTINANTVAVNGGTLRVNGSMTTDAMYVASGATLGGSGTINAPVTIADGGHIAPGNSPGMLTMGTLVLDAGSILDFELGAADVEGGPLNDLINVNGDLTLDGTLNVRIATGGTYGVGVYRLINYTGALFDNGLDLGLMPAGSANTLQTSVANQINLINTQAAIVGFNYWDGPAGTPSDGQLAGGNGTWIAAPTDSNWASADGTTNGAWADGAMAIFGGAAGTVTVDRSAGDINVSGMQFMSNGYRIEGDAITMLTGFNTLRVGDGTSAGSPFVATIASELTGDGTLDKNDLGTLVLAGTNTYTGGTRISFGTLQLGSGGASGSIVGDVTNDGTLAFNRSDATAFAGVVSGGGTVRHSGTGTTTLTAAGSSAGTLNVEAGTFEVASGASFAVQNTTVAANTTLRNSGTLSGTTGADSVALAGTFIGSAGLLDGDDQVQIASTANFAQASFDGGAGIDTLDLTHNNAVTLPSALATNFEHLTKRGSGALTLQGTVAGFTDSITLAAGSAHLSNATVHTAELRVESGVTLTGTGSLSGGLTNHGVLSPGNSPGTIQVGGNFAQSAGGRLISEIRRDGTDLVDVSGSATLAGTHEIQIEYGLYLDGTTQTLLRTGGGVTGTFASVQINPSALMVADHEVSVSAETMSFTRQATTTVTDSGTSRDRYAQWLDERIAAGGLTPEMIAYVDTLLQQPTAELASTLLGNVAEPAASISQNSVATLGASYARAVFDRFALVDGVQCASPQAASDALNCAWMHGQRQWGDADGDKFGSSYDWETDGAQFGFDRQLSSWNIGVSFAYGDTDITDARGASNELRSKMGALYGSYRAGRLGIDALALYSMNENRTRRQVVIGTMSEQARAQFDSDSYGIGARLGYRLTSEASPLVRPFAEIFYDRIDGAQFSERDAGLGNLSVRIQDREGLRGTVGLQLANDYEGYGHVFRPSIELGVAHQFQDNQSTLDVQPFAGEESFRTYGVAMDRTAYLAKASLGVSLGASTALSIGYSGEIADDHTQHEANLGVRIVW
jgi:fibronectin-binding autotransporter adhesin